MSLCISIADPSIANSPDPKCNSLDFPLEVTPMPKFQNVDLFIVALHGYYNHSLKEHYIRINQRNSIPTNKLLANLSTPTNILLLSCSSGENTLHLSATLPRGSAIITTSRGDDMLVRALGNDISKKFIDAYYTTEKNFAQVFLDLIPLFAGTYAKYTTKDHFFALDPPPFFVFASLDNALSFLETASRDFQEFAQTNSLASPRFTRKIIADDVEHFLTFLCLDLSANRPNVLRKLLLKSNANIVKQFVNNSVDGMTTLIMAAHNGHTALLDDLIEAGAHLNIANQNGYTALIMAAYKGHVEELNALIKAGANLNIAAKYGYTALIMAAYKGHVEELNALIKAGADINIATQDGYTALIMAADKGHLEALNALIKAGADLNIANQNGYTALIMAANKGHLEALNALIKAGADVNIATQDGYTALIMATCKGNVEALNALIKAGADVTFSALLSAKKNGLILELMKAWTDPLKNQVMLHMKHLWDKIFGDDTPDNLDHGADSADSVNKEPSLVGNVNSAKDNEQEC
jgi:ankyrin repeat protein